MMGPLTPGLGWPTLSDNNYKNPWTKDQFQRHNATYTNDCLSRRADQHAQRMLEEIVADVNLGRMAGPFQNPSD